MDYRSPSLAHFVASVQKERSLVVEGLWEAPKALLLHLIAQASQKTLLVITSESRGSRLLDEVLYFAGEEGVVEFPSCAREEIPPNPDLLGKRLSTLYTLLDKSTPLILFASLQALSQKTLLPYTLLSHCLLCKPGMEVPTPPLLSNLYYRKVPKVTDKGEYALRENRLDLFPITAPSPYRILFDQGIVQEIRTFDPIGQTSTGKVERCFLSPAQELPFLQESTSLLSYLDPQSWVVFDEVAALEIPSFEEMFQESLLHPSLYWTESRVETLSEVQVGKRVGRSFYSGKEPFQPLSFELFNHRIDAKRWHHPFLDLQLEELSQEPIFICASPSEDETFRERLSLPPAARFTRGYLSSGFAFADSPVSLIPTAALTHRTKIRRPKWRQTHSSVPSDFHELTPGEFIVHFHHGIGKYLGIERGKNHLGIETDFLLIEYAEKSKLFVPITQSYLINRYIGAHEEVPSFHTLGGKLWQRTKGEVEKNVIGYAQTLLRLTAEREVKGGFSFPADTEQMKAFEEEFPYVETEDQLIAIDALKKDMISSKAMDRLICGDVGYGKTEVAMRAAFKAVVEGKKQVAFLVPTTVLALQHFETLTARMGNFPIVVRAVSRFQSPKEIRQTLQDLSEGKVDILVGTHRLLSRDVAFSDLGLIIIDEEQRFGVRAKEHLKAFKVGVDCLTLTATPIPRTLYLSLIGMREISLINTPPQDRLPTKTLLIERDSTLMQEALLRELTREGQAFFIHNRVESIFQITTELQQLLPAARIVTGHGQMTPEELDKVFHAFKSGEADILVATTIIENGIDIPNANTILIDRADQFGLADLYQMRGRVGRWNRPAYAYFLLPKGKSLSELSSKRLQALIESQGYGGGAKIAMRDLEIRGAGDLLGEEQSGQMATVGFHLYCKLLKKSVEAIQKQGEVSFIETRVEFPYDARIPDTYVEELSLRLEIYSRLGEVSSFEEIDQIWTELKDRFGPCPPPLLWLYHLTRIRFAASKKKFLLLKITSNSLSTEQQRGEEVIKQTYPLLPAKTPQFLEEQVFSLMA